MKLINTQNVYTLVLTELEWYGANESQKETWSHRCRREAREAGCQYAAIMVEPDAVMSISPVAKRHKVWGHTFPDDAENSLILGLTDVTSRYRTISRERIAALLMQFAKDFSK